MDTSYRHTVRNLLGGVALLLFLMVVGTLGFAITDDRTDWFTAFWLTVNILTTVGDSAEPLTDGQRLWAIVLMILGVLTVFYVGSNIVAFIIDGELRRMLGRRQMQGKIDRMQDHYIVCGYGRMGRALCENLHQRGTPYVVIEQDPARASEADKRGMTYLMGNAMDETVLSDVGISRAKGLFACLRSDADNVFVTLTARGVNEGLTIIARAENEASQQKLLRAGANRVVCVPVMGANRVSQMMLQPAVDELMELAVSGSDIEVSKVKADHLPKVIGRPLVDLELPSKTGLMVVAVVHKDGSRRFNPPPTYAPTAGDELIVIGSRGGAGRLTEQFAEN